MSLILSDNKNIKIIYEKTKKEKATSQIFYDLVRLNHQDVFY